MTDPRDRDGSLGDVSASVELEDGRVAMSADTTAELVVRTPPTTPLSEGEPHATLRLYSSGVAVTIELDATNLAALADEIADVAPTHE